MDKLSADKFLVLVEKTRLRRKAKKYAFAVLVAGLSISETAKKYRVSKQIVHRAKDRVLKESY